MSTTETKATLLFVDDERNILTALRRMFRPQGYEILLAGSAKEGLERLQAQPVDLVISDMRMPEMDGAEFLGQVAERWPGVMRILLTGYAEMDSAIAAINRGHIYGYFSKPWEENELRLGVENALAQKRLTEERDRLLETVRQQNAELKELNSDLEGMVRVRAAQLHTALDKLEQANRDLKKQFVDSVTIFSRIVDQRPGITPCRSRFVADYAHRLAVRMKLDEQEAEDILVAGLLLQIGKVSLPERLLTRPFERLSSEDKKLFQRHALEGESLLKRAKSLERVAYLIRCQYERYNGFGYPDGLQWNEIPTGSRILSVVNDYAQILEEPATVEKAQEYLRKNKGKRYDPDVVDRFLDMVGEIRSTPFKPIIEVHPVQLRPGARIVEVKFHDRIYLKDVCITEEQIEDLKKLRESLGPDLLVRIRVTTFSSRN